MPAEFRSNFSRVAAHPSCAVTPARSPRCRPAQEKGRSPREGLFLRKSRLSHLQTCFPPLKFPMQSCIMISTFTWMGTAEGERPQRAGDWWKPGGKRLFADHPGVRQPEFSHVGQPGRSRYRACRSSHLRRAGGLCRQLGWYRGYFIRPRQYAGADFSLPGEYR